MTEYCSNCGANCSGNLTIEVKKGIYSPFCSNCFNLLEFKSSKEIRKILRKNKLSVII